MNFSKLSQHTSSVERFSENFDQEAMTYLIFFVGTPWFQKCNFWKNSLVKIFTESLHRGGVGFKVITGLFFMLFGLQFQKQLTNWCLIASMLASLAITFNVSKKIATTKRVRRIVVITAAKIFVPFDSVISKQNVDKD